MFYEQKHISSFSKVKWFRIYFQLIKKNGVHIKNMVHQYRMFQITMILRSLWHDIYGYKVLNKCISPLERIFGEELAKMAS